MAWFLQSSIGEIPISALHSTTLFLIDVGRQSPSNVHCPGIIRYTPQNATGLELESGGMHLYGGRHTLPVRQCVAASFAPPIQLHHQSAEAALT